MSLIERHNKVPKYLQLAEDLRRQIESGSLKTNDRLPSFHQLRAYHGITYNTVEKVYGLLEREGLIVRQPSRGTFVAERQHQSAAAQAARQRSRAKHRTIGICGLGFTFAVYSSYWSCLLQGMREAADSEHVQLMLLDHRTFSGWEKADGMLLYDCVEPQVLQATAAGLPCVSVVTPLPNMASVTADDQNGGYLATQHLLALGHRRIAMLRGEDDILVPRRQAGYENALQEAGVEPQVEWIHQIPRLDGYKYGSDFVCGGRVAMHRWIANGWRESGCSALLAHNDEVAVGAIEALREAGLRVPQDVSVVGFDGTAIGEYSSPRLTTIAVPLQQIGFEATKVLLRQIKADDTTIEHCTLPIELQERESTGQVQNRR